MSNSSVVFHYSLISTRKDEWANIDNVVLVKQLPFSSRNKENISYQFVRKYLWSSTSKKKFPPMSSYINHDQAHDDDDDARKEFEIGTEFMTFSAIFQDEKRVVKFKQPPAHILNRKLRLALFVLHFASYFGFGLFEKCGRIAATTINKRCRQITIDGLFMGAITSHHAPPQIMAPRWDHFCAIWCQSVKWVFSFLFTITKVKIVNSSE